MELSAQLRQITDLPSTYRRNDAVYAQLMAAFSAALTLGTFSNRELLSQTDYQQTGNGWIDVWGDLPGLSRRFQESDGTYHARIPNMILAPRDSAVAIELWLQSIEGVIGSVVENLPNWGYTVNLPATLTISQIQQIVNDLAYVRPAGMPFTVKITTGGTYLNTVNYFGPTADSAVLATSDGFIIGATPAPIAVTGPAPWNFGGRITGAWLTPMSSPKTYLGTVNYLGVSKYITTRMVQSPPSPIAVFSPIPWNFGGRVTGAWLASRRSAQSISISAATNNQLSLLPDLLMVDPTINQPG